MAFIVWPQNRQERYKRRQVMNDWNVTLKRYPQGKYRIYAKGDPAYKQAAEHCLKLCVEVYPKIDPDKFIELMREKGVPERAIREYLESCEISDDTYSLDQSGW